MTEPRRSGDKPSAPACPRTRSVVERIVGERVTPDDIAHAALCGDCGPVLARAARFDEALRIAARGLVTDELPRGVLDPALSPTVVGVVARRRPGPSIVGILAAVAVLVLATSVTLAPGGLGGPSPDPNATGRPGGSDGPVGPVDTGLQVRNGVFRSTPEIGGHLIGLRYLCRSGEARVLGATGPVVRDGIVCYSPKSLTLTSVVVITGEAANREVVEVTIRGQLIKADIDTARRELAETMAKATFLVMEDPDAAPDAGDFVLANLPELTVESGGSEVTGAFGEVLLSVRRSADGGYVVVLRPVPSP